MLESQIDYLEFTLPAAAMYDLVQLLPGGMTPVEGGWRGGYTSSALVAGGKGRVAWSVDRPEQGVHVSLGSQALATCAGLDNRWADVGGMLAVLRGDLGGHITRLDVAFDDKEGILDLDVMGKALEDDAFTSQWRTWDDRRSCKGRGEDRVRGRTLYMGSPRSDVMLLAYDKRAERLAKGHGDEVEGVPRWIRVEMRLRRERAQAAALDFERVSVAPRAVFDKMAGILRGYVEFKVPNGGDTNRRRWEPAAWWMAFLGHVAKARLAVDKLVRTIGDVKAWVSSQVAPTLALLEKAMGSERAWSYLAAEAVEGRARLRARHWAIILQATEGQAAALAG